MRKYLEKAKDVIDALKLGREIKLEEGSGKIYLIDGFVVKENIDGFHINYTINQKDKPYIEEEDKLKLEVGKFYKTRSGKRAYCYRFEERSEITKAIFSFVIDNCGKFGTDINGNFSFDADMKSDFDIVGIWEAER